MKPGFRIVGGYKLKKIAMNKTLASAEERQRITLAYNKTVSAQDWKSCGELHWSALPQELREKISADDPSIEGEIRKLKAVVLEILPPSKRVRVESALNEGRLASDQVGDTRYHIVTSLSLFERLLAFSPAPDLIDVLQS